MYVQSNNAALSHNFCCREKAVDIKYYECVHIVALVIRQLYLVKRQDFWKKKRIIEHKICVLIYRTNFVWNFLILRRIQRDMIRYVCWFSRKVSVIVVIV